MIDATEEAARSLVEKAQHDLRALLVTLTINKPEIREQARDLARLSIHYALSKVLEQSTPQLEDELVRAAAGMAFSTSKKGAMAVVNFSGMLLATHSMGAVELVSAALTPP